MSAPAPTIRLQQQIGYLFIGIWICALVGFHKTYTVFFPEFKGFQPVHHFHGAMLMSWLALLIIQPFLIRSGKFQLHRRIGKFGYLFAPLVCYSIFLVSQLSYHRDLPKMGEKEVLAMNALDIPAMLLFGSFFVLAMLFRRQPEAHLRYIAGTALLMLGPGLGRTLIIFAGFALPAAVTTSYLVAEAVLLFLLLHDLRRKQSLRPVLTVLAGLALVHLCWAFRDAAPWQTFAGWFAGWAY